MKTVGHSGSTGGYKTMLIYCPEIEVGVALLCNVRSFNAERVGYQVLAEKRGAARRAYRCGYHG
ncbi:MAG: serine hydrolase [Fidelibacterota bacterium]|nr:MAG: serine hydrolase [Candidatus Neomarinimicrobiota bacterium]